MGNFRWFFVEWNHAVKIRHKNESVSNDSNENDSDRASSIIRPGMLSFLMSLFTIRLITMLLFIQGIVDVNDKVTQADFSFKAYQGNNAEESDAVFPKGNGNGGNGGNASSPTDAKTKERVDVEKEVFSTEEQRVLKTVKDTFQDYFTVDTFDGIATNLKRGSLGLIKLRQVIRSKTSTLLLNIRLSRTKIRSKRTFHSNAFQRS